MALTPAEAPAMSGARPASASRPKRSWIMALFSLPFAGAGLAMLVFMLGPTLLDAYRAQSWHEGEAVLTGAGLESTRSDDSETYRAWATYSYRYQGRDYRGERVAIGSGGDNIGDFQQELAGELTRAYENNQPVPVWINPVDPTEATLNRDLRWGLIGIYLGVTVVFGGIGLWLLWRSLRPRAVHTPSTAIEDQPWLARPEWLGPRIRSGARTGMWGAWAVAGIWNLISIPLAVMMMQAYFDGERAALVGLLFPLLGLLLVAWAVRQTANWRRFGKTLLSMDPYPGAIGGQVGGTVDIRLPYDSSLLFRATLCCVYSYMSGSGKNRRRHERLVWQSEGLAHTIPRLEGTRLEILFDVDEDLPASDFQDQSSYHRWRLQLEAGLPGVDFDRSFEIPVFPTSEPASELRRLSTEHRQAGEQRAKAIDQVLDIQHIPGGVELYYPAFRHPKPKLIGLVLGVLFLGVAVLTGGQDVPLPLRLIFGGLGGLATAGCLYFLLLSTRVRLDHARLETRKRLLGIPAGGASVPRNEIEGLVLKHSFSSSEGKKHTVWFKLQALTDAGRAITVGYNLAGQETARQALETVSGLTGLPAAGVEEENVLA